MTNEFRKQQVTQIPHKTIDEELGQQKQTVYSQFKQQYDQELSSFALSEECIKKLEMDLLKIRNIQVDKRYFEQLFRAELTEHTSNFQALMFKITFGFFRINVSVLIVEANSQSHNFPVVYHNGFNKIFSFQSSPKTRYCIKCLDIKFQNLKEQFSIVAKEVCLQKIAEILKVGPKFEKLCGFDILIYNNCIEFAIQECQKVHRITNLQELAILKKKLSTFHSFGLIHNDIKPSNIMRSKCSKQILFIDFGLSTYIEERKGEKTWTTFCGTLEYCGKQMLKAYYQKSIQWVDLYYNDLVSLTKTAIELYSKPDSNDFDAQIKEEISSSNHYDIAIYYRPYFQKAKVYFSFLAIKEKLFARKEIEQSIFDEQEVRQEFYIKICDFIKLLPWSSYQYYVKSKFQRIEHKYKLSYFDHKLPLDIPKILRSQHSIDFLQQTEAEEFFVKVIRQMCTNNDTKTYIYSHKNEGMPSSEWRSHCSKQKILNNSYFIRKFFQYIDFRKTHSTFQEKIQAAKSMLTVLDPKMAKTAINQQNLTQCLKLLLGHMVRSKQNYYEELVPIAIRNLIILDQIQCTEIKSIIQQLLGEQISTIEKLKLKIRLQLLFEWLQKHWYSAQNKLAEIIQMLKKINLAQCFNKIIKQVQVKIVGHLTSNYVVVLRQIKQVFKDIYVEQQFIEQVIIWQISYMRSDVSLDPKLFQKVYLNKACFIHDFNQKYAYTFDFYYLSLFCSRNVGVLLQLHEEIYQRISCCLEKTELLKRFFIYYEYQNYKMQGQTFQVRQLYYLSIIESLPQIYEQTNTQTRLNNSFFDKPFSTQLLSHVHEFIRCLTQQQNAHVLQALKVVITPKMLRNLCKVFKVEQLIRINSKINSNIFSFLSLVQLLYCLLYKSQQFYIEQLTNFYQSLQQQVSQFKCNDQRQLIEVIEYQHMILVAKTKVLCFKKQHTKVIQQYQKYLLKFLNLDAQLFINTLYFNPSFVTLIYEASRSELGSRLLQIQQLYYRTLMKYRNFSTLFQV